MRTETGSAESGSHERPHETDMPLTLRRSTRERRRVKRRVYALSLFAIWMHVVGVLTLAVGFVAAGVSVRAGVTEAAVGMFFLGFSFLASAASTVRFPFLVEVDGETLRCVSVWGFVSRRPYFVSRDRAQVLRYLENPTAWPWSRVFLGVSSRGIRAVKDWASEEQSDKLVPEGAASPLED